MKTNRYIMDMDSLKAEAIALLCDLIKMPSFSSKEAQTATRIEQWFAAQHIPSERQDNNVWAYNRYFDASKPTILLNSHHDTVYPNGNYTNDPFAAFIKEEKLYGLGSNDAGGCLVSLLAAFRYFYATPDLNYNLVMVASAEEESSGPRGLNSIVDRLKNVSFAIVGEPTLLEMAIAEKGLLVLDVSVQGTASHAAHPNVDHAIYKAQAVIEWFASYKFQKVSKTLGEVKLTVTQVEAGSQHNVVPAHCNLVVDIRVNDCYTNPEVLSIIQKALPEYAVAKARSLHLGSSSISIDHPIVRSGLALGKDTYGSPTLSDQSVLRCPSLKLGPGDSTRSHAADEFIFIKEIKDGIDFYIQILQGII